tara:strand:- start:365 stop:1606 length:1242 start_codon:yes stop_codon:yes gene_type:complete
MNKIVKLKDIASFSQGIQIPIKKQLSEKLEGTVRFIRIVDYTKLENEPSRYIPNPGEKYIVEEDDVVMIRYGSKTAGMVSNGISGAIANNMFQIKIKEENIIDKNFLYWTLREEGVYKRLNNSQSSSTMPAITFDMIGNLVIKIPDLVNQKKITSILSTYDNLIENNTRRIQILEEMAQRIYKEWFVNFKYPGHENDKLADSELGMIPEGWEVIEISEKFKTVLGGTPSRKNEDYWINGTVPWINSSMVNELRVIDHSELITKEALKQSSTKLMPTRTTVLAITGATLGQVSLLEEEVCANQSVVGVYDENKTFNEFIYMTLTHIIKRIINRAGGGAQQHINKEIVNSVKIFCPKQNVVGSFNNIIIPIFDEIKNMLFKNRNLRQTRDLLLPKLISGKIDVSDLDIDTSILHD